MPLHDEEMNRRREKREAQRRRREAEVRRLKRNLILAAVLLVVCGIAIFNLTRAFREKGPEGEVQDVMVQETVEETKSPKATAPVQKDPITKIHIKAAGDLNITDSVVSSGLVASGYDYSRTFRDVSAVLSDADLTVMNFEGNVCGEPYGSATTSAPIEILHGLRNAGVDLLQTANSCIINNGMIGLTTTLQAIRSAGIEPLGAYASAQEYRNSKGYTITEVNGVKVAFVAFTKGMNGRGMPAGNENLVNLLYTDYATEYLTVDKEGITEILKNVQTEKPDIVIALVHWGSEYNEDISSTQKSIVSLMKKNGVDVILGTHPHMLQAIEYDELDGTLVAYSLGDFFGDAERGATNYSIILDIEITKDANSGTTKVTDYSYTPIYTLKASESGGDINYSRVVRIEKALEAYHGNFLDAITTGCKDSMDYALTRIEQRIATSEEAECPECGKAVTVLVNKEGNLVSGTTCKCGETLPSGSKYSDYS